MYVPINFESFRLEDEIEQVIDKMKKSQGSQRQVLEKDYDRLARKRRDYTQEKFYERHSTGKLKDL